MAVSTERRAAMESRGKTLEVDFYFDPLCPWAWRTSLWMREVMKVRPVTVRWKFLSLEWINLARPDGNPKETQRRARDPFRVMALARREHGDEAVNRLYLAFGHARHDRDENIGERDVIRRCIAEAGFDASLLERAMADDTTRREVRADEEAIATMGAFGVPTLVIGDSLPLFGPVINPVVTGEEAGEMWDHTAYFVQRRDFFELKRESGGVRR
jgi:predicted DsbA family dithiol-disulfide isomerase